MPTTWAAGNLARRLEAHGDSYFRFITEPGIEPTNNLAEQAIRFVVIDRWITQGTRGERGDRRCERIWTVMAMCRQQGRSMVEYLEAAVASWFAGEEAPSLLPPTFRARRVRTAGSAGIGLRAWGIGPADEPRPARCSAFAGRRGGR